MRKLLSAAIFATATLATVAFAAGTNIATATLATPLAAPNNHVVAAGVVWNCAGTTCTAQVERRAPVARDCRQLAREVGAISAFAVAGTALDAEGLARCNGAR